ncbi:MAG: PHP domain-containing protein [Proteobacteria bacterium]|nr:PHP domain-containing protein [Pseudomonadota bacterium]
MTPTLRALFLTLTALLLTACPSAEEVPASAYVIETLDQRVGGPSAGAHTGDFILQNGHIRAAILADRCVGEGIDQVCSSPGPGLYGGSMIDIDLRRSDSDTGAGRGNDQFAEMFSAVNLNMTATDQVEILSDGSDGGPAIIRTQGPLGDYISYIGLLGGILGLLDGWMVTDWILRPGDPYLTIRTHFVVLEEGLPPEDVCGWQPGDAGLPCDASLVPSPPPCTGEEAGDDDDSAGGGPGWCETRCGAVQTVDALNAGGTQFGDFFFAGGDVDIFLPGIGFQESQAVVNTLLGGTNPFVHPFSLDFIGAEGHGVSYALGTGGQLAAPIFTSGLTAVYGAAYCPDLTDLDGNPIQPEDGTIFTYERFLGVGEGDVGTAVDALYAAYTDRAIGPQQGAISGRVVEEGSMRSLPGVDVLVYQDTGAARDELGLPPLSDLFTQFGTDVGRDSTPDGSFGGRLPAGDYLLVVKDDTRGLSVPREVTVEDGVTLETGLIAPRPGILEVNVTDVHARDLPAKISLRPLGDAGSVSLPDLGDPYISGGISKVIFASSGSVSLEVPVGRYDVIVTRGVEYSIWNSANEGAPDGLVLNPGQVTRIDPVLGREVDTTGFIAADLHIHAVASHDSGIPLETRVATMVSEGIEFMASTDHDFITDYRPVIERMGLDEWVQGTVGLETTTMEIGHYLGFPFEIDYEQESGGALDWTGLPPTEIIAGLRDMSAIEGDPYLYIGHPRDGILGYFDQYGLDPYHGSMLNPSTTSSLLNLANPLLDADYFTLDFEGLELLNGKELAILRTPTQDETDCHRSFLDGTPAAGCEEGVALYDVLSRTAEEQAALDDLDGGFMLSNDLNGTVDDWFTLLNLGYRHTVMGNSDTHGTTSTESGCPRTYVISEVDEPELVREADMAVALSAGQAVASYGPLIRFTADGQSIGSDVTASGGTVTLDIEVQAPRWMLVDRVELYENGRMIQEFVGADVIDADAVVKFDHTFDVTPRDEDGGAQDAWYVVVALGPDDLSPVFTPVDLPKLQLNDIVVGALSEIDLGSLSSAVAGEGPAIPKTYAVHPYAITNPIWVDVDGLDGFHPLGEVPNWMRATPEE